MAKIEITSEFCKGCNLCVKACPKGILELGTQTNEKGYRYVTITNQDECIGCKFCGISCPDAVIEIYK